MAGTNDIAGNTGPMTAAMTENNFRAMSDIARRHEIKVLLASVPPAASFPWQPEVETRPPIAELNRWLESVCRRERRDVGRLSPRARRRHRGDEAGSRRLTAFIRPRRATTRWRR